MSALRYASIGEYIDFLRVYFESGGSASHYYDYPFGRVGFLIATRDFRTGGECGSLSRNIVVPSGIKHIGGDLGHNTLYLWDGPAVAGKGHSVPLYSDKAFEQFPQTAVLRELDRVEQYAFERRIPVERALQLLTSDLAPFSMREHT